MDVKVSKREGVHRYSPHAEWDWIKVVGTDEKMLHQHAERDGHTAPLL